MRAVLVKQPGKSRILRDNTPHFIYRWLLCDEGDASQLYLGETATPTPGDSQILVKVN